MLALVSDDFTVSCVVIGVVGGSVVVMFIFAVTIVVAVVFAMKVPINLQKESLLHVDVLVHETDSNE